MSSRIWSNGSFVRTAAAMVVGALIALGVSGGAGAATTPNTYTGCLVRGQMVHVKIGPAPGKPCTRGTQVSWNETAQETQADVAALNSRVDTLTADLQNEAQTREVVDNSFTNMFQDTATALDGERLDALQADVQQQITTTQEELSQETELKLQEAMQRDLKMQQSLSNILKKMSDTQQAIANNLK
jgi:hypothetical protein